jgi:hypothetical protein
MTLPGAVEPSSTLMSEISTTLSDLSRSITALSKQESIVPSDHEFSPRQAYEGPPEFSSYKDVEDWISASPSITIMR